jgi:hypothetical protein
MTADPLRSAFIERRLAALPDLVARTVPIDEIRRATERVVDASLAELERTGRYRARRIDVTGRGAAIVGPRHLGLDTSHEFVEVLEVDFPIDEHAVGDLATVLTAEFPRALDARLLVADLDLLGPLARTDVVVVAGRISTVRARRPAGLDRIELRRCTNESVITRYEQLYDDDPGLTTLSFPSSPAELSAMIDRGGLFEIVHRDIGWVGVIGAAPNPFQGLDGCEVVVEVVVPDARNRGVARAAQVHLADRMGAPVDWLWGTISAGNEPSLRAAGGAGRNALWWYGFVTLREVAARRVSHHEAGSDHVDVDPRYVASVDMTGWERVVREFLDDCVFPRRLPPHGRVVELGTARGLNFDRLCRRYGAERCLGFDVVNYSGHPRVREVDVRRLGPADDVPIAFGWNDLSDWELSPESKRAGMDFLRRNLVVGGYYMDAGFTAAALDQFDDAGLELVAVRGLIRLWRRLQ